MEFEEACVILYAPKHVKEAVMREYKVTSKEAKQAALSELKEAEAWLQEKLKSNGQAWLRMTADEKQYLALTKQLLECLQNANDILKIAAKRSLSLEEIKHLANVMEQIGFDKAARVVYEVRDDKHQEIIIKGNAIGTIKEKIDYIKGIHGVDQKTGNLILW